jgi:hypothetical protein
MHVLPLLLVGGDLRRGKVWNMWNVWNLRLGNMKQRNRRKNM